MSIGLQLLLSTTLAAAPPPCSWAHPGADPFRGDPVRALADFDLPASTRAALAAALRRHRPTDVVTITRDDIAGTHAYTDLREMHSGHGRICHGPVDRSAWSARRREPARVYCADAACVIVPVICNNISLVTRRPEHDAGTDDTPLDIEPAAGPPAAAAPEGSMPPGDFIGAPADADALPDAPSGPGLTVPVGGWPDGGMPIVGVPCCDSEPIAPGGPVAPPAVPPSAVPEPPAWALLLAGLAALGLRPRPARTRPPSCA